MTLDERPTEAGTPVFLMSIPRSGSTLLQRMLGAHSQIATTGEPWLLLPILYSTHHAGTYAEYEHRLAADAIREFLREVDGGQEIFREGVRSLAENLYTEFAQGKALFLDKTPRYGLIAPELVKVFPEAKFIFLWRNPLAVAASLIESFGKGKWNLHHFSADLFDGLANLTGSFSEAKRACGLRYEDLVAEPQREVERVCEFLGIAFEAGMLSEFAALKPTRGDSRGWSYRGVSREPLEKWRTTLATPTRVAWARRYLEWLGEERLDVMGYRMQGLLRDLGSLRVRHAGVVSDVPRMAYGLAYARLRSRILGKPVHALPPG